MKMVFGENTKQYIIGGVTVICALIFLVFVVKYVPLDPTKVEKEIVEERIHYEVEQEEEIKRTDQDNKKEVVKKQISNPEPTFDVIQLGEDNTLVIGGKAGINQEVQIYNGDLLIGEVNTNQFGEFVFIEELDPGYYDLNLLSNGVKSEKTLSIIAPDNAKILAKEGSELIPNDSEAIVTINNSESEAIVAINNSESEAIVTINNSESEAIVTINNADGTVEKVIQGSSNSNEANNLSFDSLSYSPEGTLNLSGKALPGAKVDIYIGKELVGTAFADENGFWSILLDKPVSPGDYILRFNEIKDEKVIATLDTPIRQSDLSEINVSENAIVVQPGNSLWRISRRFYGRGVLYTLIFKANDGQISNPDLIYPGQIFDIPKSKEN